LFLFLLFQVGAYDLHLLATSSLECHLAPTLGFGATYLKYTLRAQG
jgi:hypothetical protein